MRCRVTFSSRRSAAGCRRRARVRTQSCRPYFHAGFLGDGEATGAPRATAFASTLLGPAPLTRFLRSLTAVRVPATVADTESALIGADDTLLVVPWATAPPPLVREGREADGADGADGYSSAGAPVAGRVDERELARGFRKDRPRVVILAQAPVGDGDTTRGEEGVPLSGARAREPSGTGGAAPGRTDAEAALGVGCAFARL